MGPPSPVAASWPPWVTEDDAPGDPAQQIDTLCVTLAKHGSVLKGATYEKEIKARMWSNIVIVSADEGKLEQAEATMRRFDARRGFPPEVRAITALIRGYIHARNYAKAEAWFSQLLNPQLNPELGDIRPDASSFNYMIGLCAAAGELGYAEAHVGDLQRFGFKLSLVAYSQLVRGCIKAGQPRRGHRWCEALVADGCSEWPTGFPPDVVQEERQRAKHGRQTRWNLGFFDKLVTELARALADAGHTQSASRWLAYLVEGGLAPQDAPDTWEHVRAAHPAHIIPTLLSGESTAAFGGKTPRKGAPSVALPATLSGESAGCQPGTPMGLKKQQARGALVPVAQPAAFSTQGIKLLRTAIAEAEAAGLAEEELASARTALALEERRAAARNKLRLAAQGHGDLDSLAAAVAEAEAAGLHEAAGEAGSVAADLEAAREALEHLQRQATARARLGEAMRVRGLPDVTPEATPRLRPLAAAGAATFPNAALRPSLAGPKLSPVQAKKEELRKAARILYV